MKITINAIPKGAKPSSDDSLLGQHEPHKHQKDEYFVTIFAKSSYKKYLAIIFVTTNQILTKYRTYLYNRYISPTLCTRELLEIKKVTTFHFQKV